MSYIAFDAFSARLILFFLKDPVLWNIVPKYMNSFTISNSILFILRFKLIGSLPFEKTMTFDLFMFTFKFRLSQYS